MLIRQRCGPALRAPSNDGGSGISPEPLHATLPNQATAMNTKTLIAAAGEHAMAMTKAAR